MTRIQRRVRSGIKRFIYSQLYLREALLIFFGRAKPFVRFTVEATPPSLYFNFEIDPQRAQELERELALPHPLTRIRCLEGEEPFYCLTLNVYRVSGLANGKRAEWSLYVRDASGKARYLIVEAAADAGSMDPIHIITRAGQLTYECEGERLTTEIVCEDGTRFKACCRLSPDAPLVRGALEWVEANDYIYWRNGVCDRTFYDAGLAHARMRRIAASDVSIEDATAWGRIARPTPRHVIVFENPIEFAMSPWWNIDELGKGSA